MYRNFSVNPNQDVALSQSPSPEPSTSPTQTDPACGIIVPPDCDNPMLHQCGEPVTTYTPSSYRAASVPSTDVLPHAMHGKIGGLSIPKEGTPTAQRSMTEYLSRFCGATLCLDFRLSGGRKFKACGILLEVGRDFLVLRDCKTETLSMIDLKPVHYLQLYCR